jgi:hypothetical protein
VKNAEFCAVGAWDGYWVVGARGAAAGCVAGLVGAEVVKGTPMTAGPE